MDQEIFQALDNRQLRFRRQLHSTWTAEAYRDHGYKFVYPIADPGELDRNRDAQREYSAPSLLAFLFTTPQTDSFSAFARLGDYLNIRTGDSWDLFLPGYRLGTPSTLADQTSLQARPTTRTTQEGWYFDPIAFNQMRQFVQEQSEGHWTYSGGSDLVLVNAWVFQDHPPAIDWPSVQFGALTEHREGVSSLSLVKAIELISRDIELQQEDANFGVAQLVSPSEEPRESFTKKVMIGALGGLTAALIKSRIGL